MATACSSTSASTPAMGSFSHRPVCRASERPKRKPPIGVSRMTAKRSSGFSGGLSCGLLLTISSRSSRVRGQALVLTLVACIFVRPELFVALVLVTLGVACAAVRGVWRRTWRLVDVGRDVGVVLFLASLPFAVFGNPLAGGRSLFAWSQHYALAQAMQHRTELPPWLNALALVTRVFAPVASIGHVSRETHSLRRKHDL